MLFVGGQGPVSAPALRALAPDNEISVMARFSDGDARRRLESLGATCLAHDLFEPFDDVPDDFDYVYDTALPMTGPGATRGQRSMPFIGPWPDSFDAYADATGRLMTRCASAKGFVFASSISVYEPTGDDTPVAETRRFGVHTTSGYSFTKVANEAVVSFVARQLDLPTTIIRVGSASGVDGGPMKERLDLLVQGRPIPVHPDGPTYMRPLCEADAARLGIAALEAGRVPPLVVNWCGDDVVSVEEYCTYMGELVGREPVFERTTKAWCSLVPDTTLLHETLGRPEVAWRDGCRRLVEQCYPELLV